MVVDLTDFSPVSLNLVKILCNIAEYLFQIALVLAVIAFLVAAFYYLTSAGNEQRITRGKSALTYAALGAAVAIIAWGAALIIASILGGGGSFTDPCP